MSNRIPSNTQFSVLDVFVPTFNGIVIRPATVAYRRTGTRTISIGMAICNQDVEIFSAEQGRDIAVGRLVKRPITITSEARTPDGIEAAIRRSATAENLINSQRRVK